MTTTAQLYKLLTESNGNLQAAMVLARSKGWSNALRVLQARSKGKHDATTWSIGRLAFVEVPAKAERLQGAGSTAGRSTKQGGCQDLTRQDLLPTARTNASPSTTRLPREPGGGGAGIGGAVGSKSCLVKS